MNLLGQSIRETPTLIYLVLQYYKDNDETEIKFHLFSTIVKRQNFIDDWIQKNIDLKLERSDCKSGMKFFTSRGCSWLELEEKSIDNIYFF